MNLKWSTRLNHDLRPVRDGHLYESYHLCSSIDPRKSSAAPGATINSAELFVASRGFRQFQAAQSLPLAESLHSDEALHEVIARRRSSRELNEAMAYQSLSTALSQSFGITSVVETETHEVAQCLRAWPSAGGLFPLDFYVAAQRVADLDSGIYHYNVVTNALERVRTAPVEEVLTQGFLWQDFISEASVVVLFVAVFERTVAKYGERGYRLTLLDAGHAAQNLLLVAEGLHLPATAVGGFADATLARHLGIDGIEEAVVHAVALGGTK